MSSVPTSPPPYSTASPATSAVAPKGLDGVVVASTAISHVFGNEGRLVYRGYEIGQLAGKASFEEVCFLLWKGHLPNQVELDGLRATMSAQRALPDAVLTTHQGDA